MVKVRTFGKTLSDVMNEIRDIDKQIDVLEGKRHAILAKLPSRCPIKNGDRIECDTRIKNDDITYIEVDCIEACDSHINPYVGTIIKWVLHGRRFKRNGELGSMRGRAEIDILD